MGKVRGYVTVASHMYQHAMLFVLSDVKNIFYHVFSSVARCVGLQLLLMLFSGTYNGRIGYHVWSPVYMLACILYKSLKWFEFFLQDNF